MRATLLSAVLLAAALPASAQDESQTKPPDVLPPVTEGTGSEQRLTAPPERETFSFVVYGDRTSGPRKGIETLRQAVKATNLIDPAFVMTVGDLIQGYTNPTRWLAQTQEYKGVMSGLGCKWYPLAGNHDVYAKPKRPQGHIPLYKKHFGPLYYAFDYRWARFYVLFSDEKLSFSKPAVDQNMSPEQLAWLKKDLAASKANQVFVFLHHPRWIEKYKGNNWPKVHEVLKEDGRVAAVFAGHIHEYRDDGQRDGIHYYALAVTGGSMTRLKPSASFDHLNLVRVRPDGFRVSVLPIEAILGGDVVLGSEVDQMRAIQRGRWITANGAARLDATEESGSVFSVSMVNPTQQTLTLKLHVETPPGWTLDGIPETLELAAGGRRELVVNARSKPLTEGTTPELKFHAETRYTTASDRTQDLKVYGPLPIVFTGLEAFAAGNRDGNKVLRLPGKSAIRIDTTPALEELATFTLECWVRGQPPRRRAGLVAKTQESAFGIFWRSPESENPIGFVNLKGKGYLSVPTPEPWRWDQWTHLALTYDGAAARLFRDGQLVAEAKGAGAIVPSGLPLYVGADPGARGQPTSYFTGEIDEVRLSRVARYAGPFVPAKTHQPDAETLVLFRFDTQVGGLFPDLSGNGNHGRAVGSPTLTAGRE